MCTCGKPGSDAIHDPWVTGSHELGFPPVREDANATDENRGTT